MNLKEIKEVIQLMNENGLSELEMEKDGLKVRLKKGPSGAVEPNIIYEARAVSAAPHGAEPAPKEAPPAVAKGAPVKSPMVGTFYAAPAPDAAPFIQVGSAVEIGQVICIIEAMKLMNEIKSEVRGKVVEVLVHNGDPVEFGQPLFLVE
jgi:oxaloacetate decarboxylase (Na+ extruding) subunit alpha